MNHKHYSYILWGDAICEGGRGTFGEDMNLFLTLGVYTTILWNYVAPYGRSLPKHVAPVYI